MKKQLDKLKNKKLTLEQKIVYFLAERGLITNAGEVFAALRDFTHAEKMLTVEGDPGLKDDIANAIIIPIPPIAGAVDIATIVLIFFLLFYLKRSKIGIL